MFNKKTRIVGLLLVLVLIFSTLVGCGAKDTNSTQNPILDVASIDMENTMGIIEELASTTYMGRQAGTEGNKKAEDYIASYFKEIGLESPNELVDYRQPYNQMVLLNESRPIMRIEDANGNIGKEFDFLYDFRILNTWDRMKIKGSATSKMLVINDLKQLHKDNGELEGKILLIDGSLTQELSATNDILTTIVRLNKSIKGVILNNENRVNPEIYLVSTVTMHLKQQGVKAFENEDGPIVAVVDNEAFEELKQAAKEDKNLHIAADFKYTEVEAANVIGMIPGTDEELKDEYIIITGHFDHVGDNKNGTYQPGALDNGSGTAAMMELARLLKESEIQPKKTIVFIAFNGEEDGLYGSEYYVLEQPIFSLYESIVINMDMIGSKQIVPLKIGGRDSNLKDNLYKLAKELGMDAVTEKDAPSDSMSFEKKGVRAVTLIQFDKTNYHTPLDDINNVDEERLREIIELVVRYVEGDGY